MKSIMNRKKSHVLYLTLIVSICLMLFSPSSFAAGNRSYEKKIAATIGDKITIEAQLSIPNLIGILKLELPVNGKIEDTSVYVLRNVGDTQEKPSSALDDGFNMGSASVGSGKLGVEIINSDRKIYDREVFPSGYEYDPDMGFYDSFQGGDGYSTAEKGELNYYYNGLVDGRVYFAYSLEPLDYKDVYEVSDAGLEESLYSFWVGAKYVLFYPMRILNIS